jgi:uncharacterized protein
MPTYLTPLLRNPHASWVLRNHDRNSTVASRLEIAGDSASRRKGLLGRPGLDADTALIIAPCGSIHTWFMQFAIDVVFVTREGRVVKTRAAVGPWRLSGAWGAFSVVELAAGALRRSGTEPGDHLVVEEA